MFPFLKPRSKDHSDPFETPATAATLFRDLPAHDVLGRQQQVIRALDAIARNDKRLDLDRTSAVEWFDAALAADRRQLLKLYVENTVRSAALVDQIWSAAYDIAQCFIRVYKLALARAMESSKSSQWKRALPRLTARLIHFYGLDAELRVLRHERWIPGKWMDLHRLYLDAAELGIERVPVPPVPGERGATPLSVEEEYLLVLLTHLLNTGAFTAVEMEWLCAPLRAWCRGLVLESTPRAVDGFCIDVAGKEGLVRCAGVASGESLRYVDMAPLLEQLERAAESLRQSDSRAPTEDGPGKEQRLGILEKLRPLLTESAGAGPERAPRVAASLIVEVSIGLPAICQQLAAKSESSVAFESGAEAAGEPLPAESPSAPPRGGEPQARFRGTQPEAAQEPLWHLEDRSIGGMLVTADTGADQGVKLGALLAVRESRNGSWTLTVARRLNRTSTSTEVGVSIIAKEVVAVTLHAKRQAREDMGFVVDGIDVSTIGTRLNALYLPPPSRPGNPVAMKTLVIPTSEYAAGRNFAIITARSVYTVALGRVFEQRADWTWVAIEIAGKVSRAS